MIPSAPLGAALWLYDGREAPQTWRAARDTVRAVRPQAVILHTQPDPGDEAVVRAILADGWTLWLAAPANGLVTLGRSGAAARVRAWAERCATWGASGLILNAEGASAPGRPGWKPGQPLSPPALQDLAQAVYTAAREAAPGLALGLSSHDVSGFHRLPWTDLLGRCDVHLPQEYAAGTTTLRGALRRALLGEPGWIERAERGTIPAALAPGGAGWWPAYQLHSLEAWVSVALAWRWPRSAWWAVTNARDPRGLEAVTTVAAAHRAGLWQPTRALQAALGVPVTGEWSPSLYRALRGRLGLV